MATAYLAAVQGPAGFNKLIVVKRLRPALAEEPEFLRMFMEEARLSARIDHPNVVHTNEVGFDGEYHYISMEYLDGQSLESILRRVLKNSQALKGGDGPPPSDPSGIGIEEAFPLKFHLLVLMHCLQGLDFAHELKDFDGSPLNVVHRDVSPHNIMVTYDGAVKVLDFGIAKAADSSGDTRTGVMKGKCAYMPAEQFGGKSVDRRADIFAVGVMMWQAITNKKMWRGLSDAEIFQRLATGQIPTVSSVKPDVDPALEAICMKALAATPDGRYATCVEFQTAIEDYVAAHPSLRASTRELGKYVSDLFSEDRTRIRGIIEAQLGKEGKGASSKRKARRPGEASSCAGSSPRYQRLVLTLWTCKCSPFLIGATTLPMSTPYLITVSPTLKSFKATLWPIGISFFSSTLTVESGSMIQPVALLPLAQPSTTTTPTPSPFSCTTK